MLRATGDSDLPLVTRARSLYTNLHAKLLLNSLHNGAHEQPDEALLQLDLSCDLSLTTNLSVVLLALENLLLSV